MNLQMHNNKSCGKNETTIEETAPSLLQMREIMETPSYRRGQTKLPEKIGKIFASSASYKIAPFLMEITTLLAHTIKEHKWLSRKTLQTPKFASNRLQNPWKPRTRKRCTTRKLNAVYSRKYSERRRPRSAKKPQLYSPIHLSQVTLNHKTHDHKANDKTIAAAINVNIGKLQKSKQF